MCRVAAVKWEIEWASECLWMTKVLRLGLDTKTPSLMELDHLLICLCPNSI